MEIHAKNLDSSIHQEQLADYWREKAECLEEWVCELLMKNQALRMDLRREHSQHQHTVRKHLWHFRFPGFVREDSNGNGYKLGTWETMP